MIARIKKLSVRTKGMEALQAVILLGAAFVIVWGLMGLYDNNKEKASQNIGGILEGNKVNKAGGGAPGGAVAPAK